MSGLDGGRVEVALGLGGNLPETPTALRFAIGALRELLDDVRIGGLYRTEPVSEIPQAPYWNTALCGTTRLEPEALVACAKALELRLGRVRGERWGPRRLDIDLLLYGDQVIERAELTVPHPELRCRAFVLAPLADVAPSWFVPTDGPSVGDLWRQLSGQGDQGVRRMSWEGLFGPGATSGWNCQ